MLQLFSKIAENLALRSGLVTVHVVIVKRYHDGQLHIRKSTWPESEIDIKTSITLPVSRS